MSVVTIQPEMVTSVPVHVECGVVWRGFTDYPRDGAGMDGSERI
jgi:hypothetical protein